MLSRTPLLDTICDYGWDERVCQFMPQDEFPAVNQAVEVPAVSGQRLLEKAEHAYNDAALVT